MFPLSTVLFPHAPLSLHVFEERYRTLMSDCLDDDAEFGVVLISRGSEVGGGDRRVGLGTVARISHVAGLDDGRLLVVARGTARVTVTRWLPDGPYPQAEVEEVAGAGGGPDDAAAVAAAGSAVRRLRLLLSELEDVPALPHDLELTGSDEEVGWQWCGLAPLNLIDRQQLLACPGLGARMAMLRGLCSAMAEDVLAMLAGGPGE
jgi:Lon protease-like protein